MEFVEHAIPTGWIYSNPRRFMPGIGQETADFCDPFALGCYCSCMSFIVVDVEADGPIPAEYSMVCFGAVMFDDTLNESFYGQTRPISDRFVPEALAVSGFSREQHLTFDHPKAVMENLRHGWRKSRKADRYLSLTTWRSIGSSSITTSTVSWGRALSGFRAVGSAISTPAWLRTRSKRRNGRNIGERPIRTIRSMMLEAMLRHWPSSRIWG